MERNREQIDKNGNIINYINVLNGYLDGKEIECREKGDGNSWYDNPEPTFDFNHCEYRVKQKPAYRPYISGNEVFTDIQNHSSAGWLYNTITMCYEQVICIGDNGISTCKKSYSFDEAFGVFVYPNDLKFGVKLDEKV